MGNGTLGPGRFKFVPESDTGRPPTCTPVMTSLVDGVTVPSGEAVSLAVESTSPMASGPTFKPWISEVACANTLPSDWTLTLEAEVTRATLPISPSCSPPLAVD